MTATVSVVIPSWNGRHLLQECLEALGRQTLVPDEILVVDNGSTDGTAEFLRENHPSVRLIELERNHGFAEGVNRGIEATSTDLIALLNNDAFPEPDWLELLVERIGADGSVAGCTGKLLLERKREGLHEIDSTGDFYSIWGIPFPRGRFELDKGQYDLSEEVFSVSGGASLYRRSMFDRVGMFDPSYVAYFEDVDLCFRARLAGMTFIYEPKAVAYHRMGATSGGAGNPFTRFHIVKNTWPLFMKNVPGPLLVRYLPTFLLGQLILLMGSARRGLLIPHLRGLVVGLRGMPRFIQERRRIHEARSVRSAEIDRWITRALPPLISDAMGMIGRRLLRPRDQEHKA